MIRLIAKTNDALGLSAGNFVFPIYRWKAVCQKTQTTSVRTHVKPTIQARVRTLRELIGVNPAGVYTTLPERLSGIPKGYSWKIEETQCLFMDEGEIRLLGWHRDTIHKSYSTEESYQDYILDEVKACWDRCVEYFGRFEGLEIGSFKPSILVLEEVDGDVEMASDEDFLYRLKSGLFSYDNPVSRVMYEVVNRVEKKRGTWEYIPYGGPS